MSELDLYFLKATFGNTRQVTIVMNTKVNILAMLSFSVFLCGCESTTSKTRETELLLPPPNVVKVDGTIMEKNFQGRYKEYHFEHESGNCQISITSEKNNTTSIEGRFDHRFGDDEVTATGFLTKSDNSAELPMYGTGVPYEEVYRLKTVEDEKWYITIIEGQIESVVWSFNSSWSGDKKYFCWP
ncbi:hypothetical protein CW735_15675 [Alteromonas sp. MB-3u-76]|uniref:hypothetical protein n=1 Tax=Alteromonas sp. MB-3u-76 TaxID=2058133 RepID=UPI000C31A7EA|nr:hypothetical protein [Alteromonas sp. MB-3u-76]AUC89449.1 hypothetical protein CW735_15675 [Alteromonas sp. MB-3u-76]